MIVMRLREPVAAVGQPEDPVTVDMRPGNPVLSITNKEDLAVGRPKGSQTKRRGKRSHSRESAHRLRADNEIERHLSRTPRRRSPSLDRGVRFREESFAPGRGSRSPGRYRGNSGLESSLARRTTISRSPTPPRTHRSDEVRDERFSSRGRSSLDRPSRRYRSPGRSSGEEGSPSRGRVERRAHGSSSDHEDSGYGGVWGPSRGHNPYKMTNRAWPLFDPDKHRWDEFKAHTVLKALRMGADERDVSANLADVLPGEAVIYLENRGIAGRSLNTVLRHLDGLYGTTLTSNPVMT
jgi:hypothetical protein